MLDHLSIRQNGFPLPKKGASKKFVKAAGFNSVIILESALIQATLFVAVESTRHILRKLERQIKLHLAMEEY